MQACRWAISTRRFPLNPTPQHSSKKVYGNKEIVAALGALVLLASCSPSGPGFLNAAGPVASGERDLFIHVATITLIVVIPVLILTPFIAWRYHRSNSTSHYQPWWEFSWPLEILAWGVPVLIVIALAFFFWRDNHLLDPYRPIDAAKPPITINVVGLNWKWLFIWPGQNVAAVNELVIPVGRPVRLRLTSDTAMQSFMVPKLAGQIYVMAGMTTELNLMASRPGVFDGFNAQYNGEGFPQQRFRVRAVSTDDYRKWIKNVQLGAHPLDASAYKALTKRTTVQNPTYFSDVDPELFSRIVHKYHDVVADQPGAKQLKRDGQ